MWQKFTQLARRSILIAQNDAASRGSMSVDVLHLLVGVIRVDYDGNWENGVGVVSDLLTSNGVDAKSLHLHIASHLSSGSAVSIEGEPPLTQAAKRVLEDAVTHAIRMRNNFIGPEHLFLAIACTPQGAFVLADFGLNLEDLSRQLGVRLKSPQCRRADKPLSEEFEAVLERSRRVATLSGCGCISCAHLLLAVLDNSEVQNLLKRCDVDLADLQENAKSCLISDNTVASAQAKYSNGAKRVLHLARQEAADDKDWTVRPVHLLMALAQTKNLQPRWRKVFKPPHPDDILPLVVLRNVTVEQLRRALQMSPSDENTA